jgi:hypothetical protein
MRNGELPTTLHAPPDSHDGSACEPSVGACGLYPWEELGVTERISGRAVSNTIVAIARALRPRRRRVVTRCVAFALAGISGCANGGGNTDPQPTDSSPALGAHGLVFTRQGVGQTQVVTTLTTQARGSILLAGVGRGAIVGHRLPTDSRSSTFSQLGTSHNYSRNYPTSGTALYAATSVSGGSGHAVRAANDDALDEVTLGVVEVQNGTSITHRWNEVFAGAPLTSQSITTTGPALLVAYWWGDADGSAAHTAVPNNGFTVIESALGVGNFVQCAIAVRQVSTAGTYNVTWTSNTNEGAQLYLIAIQ